MFDSEENLAHQRRQRIDAVLVEIGDEVERAMRKHKPINSPHEGYAVIAEELDELWDDVRADRGREDCARNEALQTAAMGVRYILDVGSAKKQSGDRA